MPDREIIERTMDQQLAAHVFERTPQADGPEGYADPDFSPDCTDGIDCDCFHCQQHRANEIRKGNCLLCGTHVESPPVASPRYCSQECFEKMVEARRWAGKERVM